MHKRLPTRQKVQLIGRVLNGESISAVCRESGISRTIFYHWLKEYKQSNSLISTKHALHWRKYSSVLRRKILHYSLSHPQSSTITIADYFHVSTGFVWKVLKAEDLNTTVLRDRHLSLIGKHLLVTSSSDERLVMMRRFEAGDKVSDVCRDFRISRTTFYKWLKRYQQAGNEETNFSLESKRAKGNNHWRYISNVRELVRDIVIAHPEFSAQQIKNFLVSEKKDMMSASGIYRILRELDLNTYEKRLDFSNSQHMNSNAIHQVTNWELPTTPRYSYNSTLSPPATGLNRLQVFSLISSLSFVFSALILWLFTLFVHVQNPVTAVGLVFALISFSFGMFFFFYSLKYFIMVAIVLSFSREDDSERTGAANIFERVFGFSVRIGNEGIYSGQAINSTKGIGLRPDLSQINLERQPFVSIHVSTYNEKRVIDRLLTAATSMDYENYEVIVADDSNDETVDLLERWKSHPRVKVSHRENRTGYKGQALALALTKVDPRTEFILVFDADFIPYPDSITQFLKYFKAAAGTLDLKNTQNPIAAVQGYQWHVLNKSENWITRGVRSEYSGSYVIERSGTEVYGGLKQISGSVYMVRRDIVEQIGWGRSITEDFEFTLKLYERGFKVVYTPYVQAPAEAASTIKRLIRQRMRWAEGHSYNIKKMFGRLLFGNWVEQSVESRIQNSETGVNNSELKREKVFMASQLNLAEKFELIYLAPYYLQAAFFMIGTFAWFMAEVVFRTRLPFWTEIWGWSLVFTNLFALPLMNLVGLFMEESEEKDYLGLFSFIALSYIVAPFQAYAAVKGFLEKEEGPWFRTPKTGRITDTFMPGRLSRFVRGVFGIPSPVSAMTRMTTSLFTPTSQAAFLPVNPYVALGTANNRFNSGYSPRRKGWKWTGKGIVASMLIVVLMLNYLSFFPQNNKADAAWYNTGYLRKKAITIDHTKVGKVDVDTANESTSNGGTAITSLTWSHTTGSQSNRLLIVGVALQNETDSVSTVTFNGTTSLSLVPGAAKSCSSSCRSELWYVVNPPASTTANIVVSITGSATSIVAGAVTLYNVDQTTPLGTAASAGDTGTTATSFNLPVTTVANQLVVDAAAGGGAGSLGWVPNSSQTSIWSNNTRNNGAGSFKQSSGTTTTMSWTDASSDNWSDVAVPVNPAALSNFPVLISRTDTDLKTAANGGLVQNSNGYDIIFTESTEATKLDHEIEKYVASTGEIEMWVRVPTLSATSDTVIYIYFDNSAISTSQENKTGVWDSSYKGVWHMGESSGILADSTSNGSSASKTGTVTQGSSAQIGNGVSFSGSSGN